MFLISSNIVLFIELDILLKGRQPPTPPLISQFEYYCNRSCRVRYQHSLINPDSQQTKI